MTEPLSPATQCVALGREPVAPGAQVNAPLVLSSTFHADGRDVYARESQPTWRAFEEALGALEGGQALVLSSGMAAVAAALSLVPLGGLVVAPSAAYNGVLATLAEREQAGELRECRVPLTDPDRVEASLAGASLLWLESPSNPLLDVADLPRLIEAARARGVLTVVDNTFATPLVQRPLDLGADLVVHSATKYLSGHSDVVLGAVVTADSPSGRDLGARIQRYRHLQGAIAGPFETWLALRGLRTLPVRLERAQANATELALRLREHPAVEEVRYPGFGAIVAPVLRGGAGAGDRLVRSTSIWVHATSLGGVESTFERRRRWVVEPTSIPEGLVRMSVGIEDVEDLWADLEQALDQLS